MRVLVPYVGKLPGSWVAQITRTQSSFSPGTGSCGGCGGMLAMRNASKVINWVAHRMEAQTVHTQQTGCIEVVVSSGDQTASRESFLHASFSDGPSVLRGIVAAYDARRERGEELPKTLFWNFSGDGGTLNIGMRSFSAFLQAGKGLLLIYDNRGFMNTGAQWSSSTLPGERRTTAQVGVAHVGVEEYPKELAAIAAAHEVPYAATASVGKGYMNDFLRKIAIGITLGQYGPAVVLVDAPCPREQKFQPDRSRAIGQLAVETGVFPIYEVVNGKWIVDEAQRIKDEAGFKPARDFLKTQDNLSHLLRPGHERQVEEIQTLVDQRWQRIVMMAGATEGIPIKDLTVELHTEIG